jgi:MFS family permease
LGITPLWLVIVLNIALMIAVLSRMISSSALMTAVPDTKERGAFMSVNSSLQQISGGIASIVAGLIVVQTSNGTLKHYNTLGYIVVVSVIITIFMMHSIDKYVLLKTQSAAIPISTMDDNLKIVDKKLVDVEI